MIRSNIPRFHNPDPILQPPPFFLAYHQPSRLKQIQQYAAHNTSESAYGMLYSYASRKIQRLHFSSSPNDHGSVTRRTGAWKTSSLGQVSSPLINEA